MIINQNPVVSIIIPTLNEADRIGALLEELQDLLAVEIIISDGGSTDHTLETCAAYPVIVCTGSAGRGKQLNRGAQAAKSDILLFLHADTHMPPELVPQMIEAVRLGKMWGCARLAFDDSAFFFRWLAFISNCRARLSSSCYGDQAMFCQRDFFSSNGMFPETDFLEDIAFSHKVRQSQRAFVLAGKVVTSSRRFRYGSRWRMLGKIQLIKLLFFLGVSPERLYTLYR